MASWSRVYLNGGVGKQVERDPLPCKGGRRPNGACVRSGKAERTWYTQNHRKTHEGGKIYRGKLFGVGRGE